MPYGTIKVDTVTFTNAGVDKSVTLSGLVQNPVFSGNVTVTGTLSGVTVTGTTANFTSGNFTNISGGTHTITSGVFAAGSAASPSITFTGDLNTGIYSPGADQVAISTGGSGKLFIGPTGDIGVGISSWSDYADRSVHLYSNTNPTFKLTNSTTGTDLTDGIEVILSGSDGYLWNRESASWILGTNNTERLRITSAGLVGVGTSSPSELLHIAGVTNPAIVLQDTTNNTDARIKTNNNGDLVFEADYNGEAADTRISFEIDGSEKARFDSSGRLGVGTTSPSGPLAVVSDSGGLCARLQGRAGDSIGTLQFRDNADTATQGYIQGRSTGLRIGTSSGNPLIFLNDSTEQMRLDSSGRLGIGTSSPGALLHVASSSTTAYNGTAFNTSRLYLSGGAGTGAYNSIGFTNAANAEGLIGFVQNASGYGDFVVQSYAGSYGEKLRVTSAGNVGIGTTSPNATLVVSASSSAGMEVTPGSASASSGTLIEHYNRATSAYVQVRTLASIHRFDIDTSEALRIDSSGRLLVGTSTSGTSTGTGQLRLGGAGDSGGALFLTNSGANVANNGTVDLTVGTSSIIIYVGFLIVHAADNGTNGNRTQTTFSVFGSPQNSSFTATQISTASAGASSTFTVTSPSAGVIRVTNTRGGQSHISMCFMGTGWFMT